MTAISFDQCRLGQLVKKATTLATDLPIQDWDQMRCTHQSHVGTNESSTLSRYPWDMMAGLAKAIAVSLAAPGHIRIPSQFPGNPKEPPKGRGSDPPEGLSPGENGDPVKEAVPPHHTRAQSPEARTPRSPACTGDTVSPRGTMNPDFPSPMPPMAGDAEQLGKEGQGDQVLDRSECLPAFRVPHLTDRVAIVQLGFPSRMGGENPCPGRLNPPFRRISPLATLGALIMTLTRPWIDKVRMSLASGATTHPFQEADLEELRAILGPSSMNDAQDNPSSWT